MGLAFAKLGGVLAPCGSFHGHPVMSYPYLFSRRGPGSTEHRVGASPLVGARVEWLRNDISVHDAQLQSTFFF